MTDYKRLCIEQAEIIDILQAQVHRLLAELEQYTDIEMEERQIKMMEDRLHDGSRS